MKWKLSTAVLALGLITGMVYAQNGSSNNMSEILNGSNMTSENVTDENMTDNVTEFEGDAAVETLIVASSRSHLDATVADAASERLGVPVVLSNPDRLSSSTENGMEALEVEQAIIIGGPAAFSEDVEQEINSLTSEETVRVYGQTASDTSIQVADYFWPEGYDETRVVQSELMQEEDETYRLLSAVMNTAGENPVLLAGSNTSGEEVLDEIESENPSQVTGYSLDNTTNNSLEEGLNDLDTEVEFNQGTVEDLTSDLYSDIQDNPDNNRLYALAGQSFSFGIPTYAAADSAVYTVTSTTVSESVSYIEDSGFETVNVVGQQEIGGELASDLNETGFETSFTRGDDAVEVSASILGNNAQEWSAQRNEELIQQVLETEPSESENGESDNETGEVVEDPENQSETNQNQTDTDVSGESELELTSTSSTVTGEASYTSDQRYTKIKTVQETDSEITFIFRLVEPQETNQTEQLEEDEYSYSFTEEVEPETGEYETQAQLMVNGQTIDTATGTAEIQ